MHLWKVLFHWQKIKLNHYLCFKTLSLVILIGRSPSPGFVYIGAGAPLPPDAKIPKSLKGMDMGAGEMAKVTFESNDPSVGRGFPEREPANLPAR